MILIAIISCITFVALSVLIVGIYIKALHQRLKSKDENLRLQREEFLAKEKKQVELIETLKIVVEKQEEVLHMYRSDLR
jgi:hypothetical protein